MKDAFDPDSINGFPVHINSALERSFRALFVARGKVPVGETILRICRCGMCPSCYFKYSKSIFWTVLSKQVVSPGVESIPVDAISYAPLTANLAEQGLRPRGLPRRPTQQTPTATVVEERLLVP